jgi:hypothetical protein
MIIGLISVAKAASAKVVATLAGSRSGTKTREVDGWACLPMDPANAPNTGFDSGMIDVHRAARENDLTNVDITASCDNAMGLASSEARGATSHGRTILTGLIEALSKMPHC